MYHMNTMPLARQLIFILLAMISTSAGATSLLPLSLEQLSTRAELIFYGSVVKNEVVAENDGKRVVTLTSFEVHEQIKGSTGKTHTIKQIGGKLADGRDLRVHGVPRYQVGQSYVVFLPAPSSLGFSSPLGLHQGNFSVMDEDGVKTVSNGLRLTGNTAGAAAISPLATAAGDDTKAELDSFIGTVRAYTGQ